MSEAEQQCEWRNDDKELNKNKHEERVEIVLYESVATVMLFVIKWAFLFKFLPRSLK